MKIAIGSDHAGFQYKQRIISFLEDNGHEVVDFGTDSEEAADYPLFIRPAALAVQKGKCDRGIVLGGSGNGEAMTANRLRGIRCALCWDRRTAELARLHNDANMISIGARMVSIDLALEIVKAWLETPFEGGRHIPRIRCIDEPDAPVPTPAGKAPSPSDKDSFDLLIAFRYIKYMEGPNEVEFQVDPGLKTPSVIHIPSPKRWTAEMPLWARDRRQEILDRIQPKCAHLKAEWREY